MYLLESLSAGIIAWVTFAVLMQPGMILGWYGDMVSRWYNEWPREWAWMAKPLGYCGQCFAGQIGFWWFVLRYSPTDLFANLVFAGQTIFFFLLIQDVKTKLNEQRQNGHSGGEEV